MAVVMIKMKKDSMGQQLRFTRQEKVVNNVILWNKKWILIVKKKVRNILRIIERIVEKIRKNKMVIIIIFR